jgi:uncharacterized protein YndB with AHSA1/START domain
MKAIKLTSLVLTLLLVLFFLVGVFLPKHFYVERKLIIDAPAPQVFQHIIDLREWKKWGIWFKRDPNMQVTYSGPDSAVGMKSSWISAQEGSGEMTILDITPDSKMVYSLYFPDFDMGSKGDLMVVAKGQQTEVSWSNYGDLGSNPVNGYFAMMMDGMIGPDFEAGLANLKELTEN